jgi:hypothetical protein
VMPKRAASAARPHFVAANPSSTVALVAGALVLSQCIRPMPLSGVLCITDQQRLSARAISDGDGVDPASQLLWTRANLAGSASMPHQVLDCRIDRLNPGSARQRRRRLGAHGLLEASPRSATPRISLHEFATPSAYALGGNNHRALARPGDRFCSNSASRSRSLDCASH